MQIEVEVEIEEIRGGAAIDLGLDLATRSHTPFRPNGRGTVQAVPYVRWILRVLSIARTQENGESNFHTSDLFHPSTIYITEERRMYKSFHRFNEKLTCGVYWPFGQAWEGPKSMSMEISFINSSRSRHWENQKENRKRKIK
jgi:hypothetical protein